MFNQFASTMNKKHVVHMWPLVQGFEEAPITRFTFDFGSVEYDKFQADRLVDDFKDTHLSMFRFCTPIKEKENVHYLYKNFSIINFDHLLKRKKSLKTEVVDLTNSKESNEQGNGTEASLSSSQLFEKSAQALADALKAENVTHFDLRTHDFPEEYPEACVKTLFKNSVLCLYVTGAELTDKGGHFLSDFLRNTRIDNLEMHYRKIDYSGVRFLADGMKSASLKSISMTASFMNTEALEGLSECLKNSQAIHLKLKITNFGRGGVQALSRALRNTRITHLDISTNQSLTNEDLRSLSRNLKFTQISNLYLSEDAIDDEGIKALTAGLWLSYITYLDLENNCFGSKGAKILAKYLPYSKITYLNLSSNRIKCNGAVEIAEGLKGSLVTHVEIEHASIGDKGFRHLGECLKETVIEYLNLGRNFMGQQGAIALAEGLKDCKVKYLDLSSNVMGEENAIFLAGGFKSSKVTDLFLSSNSLCDKGVSAIIEGLKGSSVVNLDLSNNNFGVKGAKQLARFLKDTQVTYLNLSLNNIEKQGALALGKAIRSTRITDLVLDAKSIRQEGALGLIDILRNTQVVNVIFTATNFGNNPLPSVCSSIVPNLEIKDPAFEYVKYETYLQLREVLYKNFSLAKELSNLFKKIYKIMQDTDNNSDENFEENLDAEKYVDCCIHFMRYMNRIPGMVSHLISDMEGVYSKEEILRFVQEIPRIFCTFLACRLEANLEQYLGILLLCERLNMVDVVRNILLHRNIFVVDVKENILHPIVYKLLDKYGMPIYSESLEPQRRQVIIDYFKKNPKIEGALEAVLLLEAK